jgi:hypothetical protein
LIKTIWSQANSNSPPRDTQLVRQTPAFLGSAHTLISKPTPKTVILLSPVLITSGAEFKTPPKEIQDGLHVEPESSFVYIPPSKPIPKISTWSAPETTATIELSKAPPVTPRSRSKNHYCKIGTRQHYRTQHRKGRVVQSLW